MEMALGRNKAVVFESKNLARTWLVDEYKRVLGLWKTLSNKWKSWREKKMKGGARKQERQLKVGFHYMPKGTESWNPIGLGYALQYMILWESGM